MNEGVEAFLLELANVEESEGVAPPDRSLFLPGASDYAPVLILHGTPGTVAEVAGLARSLNLRGYPVAAPLLPGHGRKDSVLGAISWEVCLELARECWRRAQTESAPRRAHLVGYSFGGFLALLLAAESAPAALVTLAAYVYPHLGIWKRLLKPWARLRIRMGSPLWRWKLQLADLAPQALAALPRIGCPTLVIHGEADSTVSPRSAHAVHSGIASAEKDLRLLPATGHLLLSPGEHAEGAAGIVLPEVLAFLAGK